MKLSRLESALVGDLIDTKWNVNVCSAARWQNSISDLIDT